MRRTAAMLACLLPIVARAAADPAVEAYEFRQRQCEAERAAKLQPLRAVRVDQCVRSGRDRSDCEAFFSTYGDNATRANGSTVRGLFYDLPACRAADNALKTMNTRQNF